MKQKIKDALRRYRWIRRAYWAVRNRLDLVSRFFLPTRVAVGRWVLSVGNDFGMKSNYITPSYYTSFKEIVARYVSPGDVVLDIGAHVGVTTFMLLQRVGTHGKIFSFEPTPYLFGVLQENLMKNNITNVEPIPAALAAECGSQEFFTNETHTGANSLNRDNAYWVSKNDADVKSITVATMTLDEFLDTKKIVPKFIKIDTQGAEYEIFKGAQRFLERADESTVFYIEFWPLALRNLSGCDPKEFLQFLEEKQLKIEYSEDFYDMVIDGIIPKDLRHSYIEKISSLEREYTNLVIRKCALVSAGSVKQIGEGSRAEY